MRVNFIKLHHVRVIECTRRRHFPLLGSKKNKKNKKKIVVNPYKKRIVVNLAHRHYTDRSGNSINRHEQSREISCHRVVG